MHDRAAAPGRGAGGHRHRAGAARPPGRGYGGLLYARGLARARELGAERIQTVVLESSPEGLRFALAHGFEEVERYVLPGDTVPYIDLELRELA